MSIANTFFYPIKFVKILQSSFIIDTALMCVRIWRRAKKMRRYFTFYDFFLHFFDIVFFSYTFYGRKKTKTADMIVCFFFARYENSFKIE